MVTMTHRTGYTISQLAHDSVLSESVRSLDTEHMVVASWRTRTNLILKACLQ